MTGVGLAAGPTEVGELRIEVRTVNGRALQQKLRLAGCCSGFEAAIEGMVRDRLRRGSVTVVVEQLAGSERGIDPASVRRAADELRQLAAAAGVGAPTLADVMAWLAQATRGQAVTSRPLPPQVGALLATALDDLERHRYAEGEATATAIAGQLAAFERDVAQAAVRAPQLVDRYRERLLQRVGEFAAQHLSEPMPAADLVREVALYADRVDVAEELQRLQAHVAEFRAALQGDGEVGRRLEFLLQELLRETNTLGSKSPDCELSHTVVAMKSAIDRLKEQVANLE
jgi:uncharacterized protein (TIGR00255 family)